MAKFSANVKGSMLQEIYNRSLSPAIAYFVLGLLVIFYRFHVVAFERQIILLGILMCVICFVRIGLSIGGAKKKDLQQKLLIPLKATIILHALNWAAIFGLAAYDLPVGTADGMVSFAILTGVASACPTSLIALPTIQILFLICTQLVPAATYILRYSAGDEPVAVLILPFTLIIYFFYLFGLSRKLRADLILIFEQQERIRQDLAAAKDIQRSLLPETSHQFGQTRLDILYKPSEELSGDFFEIYKNKNDLLFYVADVTSHGTASAQVTFLLKGIFKNITARLEDEIDIAVITKKMAEDYVTYQLKYSVSLFVAHYDLIDGSISYVTSNFPDPVVTSSKGLSIMPTLSNPLIDTAFFDGGSTFKASSAVLAPGESFYVFTDGSYEFKDSSKNTFGFKRFTKILTQASKVNWAESVYKGLQSAQQSTVFEDDITVLRLMR